MLGRSSSSVPSGSTSVDGVGEPLLLDPAADTDGLTEGYQENDVNAFFDKVLVGVGVKDVSLKRIGDLLRKACEENDLLQVIRGTLHLAVLYQAERTKIGSAPGPGNKAEMGADDDETRKKARRRRRSKKRQFDDSTNTDTNEENKSPKSNSNDERLHPDESDYDDNQSIRSDGTGAGKRQEEDVKVEELSSPRLPEDIEIDPDSDADSMSDEDIDTFPDIEDFEILENHTEKSESSTSKYECNICKKKFSHQYILKGHLRVHTNERPFKCEKCSKTFKSAAALKVHGVVHNDERPFKCDFPGCSIAFKRAHDLKTHKRMHAGEKPFKCHCGKRFSRSSRMRSHQMKCSNQE